MQRNLKSGRRAFLKASALSAVALTPALRPAVAATNPSTSTGTYPYEVTRSQGEWQDMLTKDEFRILRLGKTEAPHSHKYVQTMDDGSYACRGCDLEIYKSDWKVILDVGWVFFKHSEPNSVLTAVDGQLQTSPDAPEAMIEAHCRRCGSHLGHILVAQGALLHCINGTSLHFNPTSA